MELEGWIDRRYALRYDRSAQRYELLDFIRWDEDTTDDAHMVYFLDEIIASVENEVGGIPCVTVIHVDGSKQDIPLDSTYSLDIERFNRS